MSVIRIMTEKSEIPITRVTLSGEAERVNANDLYSFLGCKEPFKKWINELIDSYKGYDSYVIVKEPARGSDELILIYYINLKTAKVASLQASSKQGEKAYNYLRSSENNLRL